MVRAGVFVSGALPEVGPAQAHRSALQGLAVARAWLGNVQADQRRVAGADHALYAWDRAGDTGRLHFWPVHILTQTATQYRVQVAAGADVPAYVTTRIHLLPRPPLDRAGHARAGRHDTFATADYLRALLGDEEAQAAARVRRAEERVARSAAALGRAAG
jgi:hypothetical protein